MIKRCLTSLVATLIVCFLACSSASARVCFLPDSTDCGEGDVAGSGNVDVPCQYSSCPAYNTKYQTCYTERIYNNGGVNVECKQVKCSLSKSDCEKQEADPNSSQCCNFDSASGCYYMGSCKLCNRDVYDSEKNLGEGYNCYPCKDKNGTFYNCTAIEKECKDINPDYTSKCADSQTAEEVKGVKDSKGNQCYTCKDKPIDTPPVEPTCADLGYKTCAICSANQICELNGQQGSDGPCATGCHNTDTAICRSVTSVSTKYNYLKKMIDGLAINQEAFSHLGSHKDFDLYETMSKSGLVQPNWEHRKGKLDQTYIADEDGNLISVFMRNDSVGDKKEPRVHVDIYLDKTFATLEKHQVMPIDKCKDVYKNLMKPLYCQVHHVGVYSTNYKYDKMTASYGEGECGYGQTCLQNISDEDILKACNSCQKDNKQCYLPIIFLQKYK